MRIRLPLSIFLVTTGILIGSFTSSVADPAPAKDDKKTITDDRDALSAKLYQRVTLDKPLNNLPIKEVVETLGEKFEVSILIDAKSFPQEQPAALAPFAVAAAPQADDDILARKISVPAMKNVRLATILKHVADQIKGFYLLYPDHIEIVGYSTFYVLTNPVVQNYLPETTEGEQVELPFPNSEVLRSIPLVHANFKEVPLQEALREIELRSNHSIVLASHADDKAKTTITARFTNVPVDSAVATLAASAGLKMIRKGNVLLVTTAEQQTVDELRKKIVELEKTIAALTKKQ